MPIDVNYFYNLPQGQSILFTAQSLGVPCETIFVSAIIKDLKKNLPTMDRDEIYALATEACKTQNPDIIWQIFKVETNFRVHIVNIGGEKILVGQSAKNYLEKGLQINENIDIGPLQINWRANGAHHVFDPQQYFKGSFSVRFISAYLLKDLVASCKSEWINCYHSRNKIYGDSYRIKIERSGYVLKKILYDFLNV